MSSISEIREQLIEKLTEKLAHSVPETADLLGCSERGVYNMIGRGELESYKQGPRRKIPTTGILKYIEDQVEECR
jgi:excisionase family DNA binding protein